LVSVGLDLITSFGTGGTILTNEVRPSIDSYAHYVTGCIIFMAYTTVMFLPLVVIYEEAWIRMSSRNLQWTSVVTIAIILYLLQGRRDKQKTAEASLGFRREGLLTQTQQCECAFIWLFFLAVRTYQRCQSKRNNHKRSIQLHDNANKSQHSSDFQRWRLGSFHAFVHCSGKKLARVAEKIVSDVRKK
jgi:hypothetical protein